MPRRPRTEQDRSVALRLIVVAVLVLASMLAGIQRSVAVAAEVETAHLAMAWAAGPICHAGSDDTPVPADPADHDCCDACIVLAPALLATPPLLPAPPTVPQRARTMGPAIWLSSAARQRSPRQSRAPPAA